MNVGRALRKRLPWHLRLLLLLPGKRWLAGRAARGMARRVVR
ncbi:hypothetical protein ACFFX1_49160 [Dactylosporangium sucinum]|uniref:Uncharacterized protein n=1 Tax=Dactylosporangium sucinum TaxID=1424081 RepID=A0A917UE63_9ACTN|nr:hypothetical protein [Dactylosporangium sucinum]GGM86904.1 hypothetical protein GCM10007977_106020 [Dactylosporangium sucinum]